MKFYDIWYILKIRKILSLSQHEKSYRGIKRTVRLLSNFPGLWQRTFEQTPKGCCQFGNTLFVADGEADHYVILNSIYHSPDNLFLPKINLPKPYRVWGLHMEPEAYIRQLGYDTYEEHSLCSRFYTSSESLLAKGGIYQPSPPYVNFLTGKDWDYLSIVQPPRKLITLGIIVSDLNHLEGHKARIRFLEEIDESGIDCAIWGRGDGLKRFRNYRGFALSKWDAQSICRYSIVIENSVSPWYWSEKVADALLAYSLPLYYGCPNLGQFFPADSFIQININELDCMEHIRDILKADPYNDRIPAIKAARLLLLEKENIYAFLDRELDRLR
ncbi:MAG: hypothetical protein JJE30_15510 [Desulfuromonadales bacterium]|nr:hypothetical protein [Desulfuromonadales bacterium]